MEPTGRSRSVFFRSSVRESALLCLPLLLSLSFRICMAQDSRPTESQVKAAYLYNFGKFVEWPSARGAVSGAFEICVLGRDPFGAVLDSTVDGESVAGRKIVVQRIHRVQDAVGCNILFISSSEESRLTTILGEAGRMRLLTVSDIPHFAERGGVIGLVNQEGRIRFEVNRSTAEENHLALSSELLRVAIRVIEKRRR